MEKILKVSDICFEYPSYQDGEDPVVFRNLSFEVEKGETVVIIGGTESGKSTLAFILASLVPEHTGGRLTGCIELDGKDVPAESAPNLIEHCGIVFQDAEKQTVTTDCFSEAAFALESLGIPEEEIRLRVESAFDFLNIRHLLGSDTDHTSGGEKKKLAVAGIIGVNPSLWILDDCMEELDNPSRRKLMDYLKQSGRSVIILTSKFYEIFNKADSFYHLAAGRLSGKFRLPFSEVVLAGLREDGIIPDYGLVEEARAGGRGPGGKLLELEDIRFRYETGFELRIDCFELREGETLSIVGRNGCGKSTLGKILCGLIEPSEGSIRADGNEAEPEFLNSFCAYMFQNPDYQIFLPTVADELGWGLKETGASNEEIRRRVREAIEIFNLPDEKSPPALMSFSARKRLQAAVYYLLERSVYILDEADTGLSFRDFLRLTAELKATGRGIIIITHNLELASAVSDRVMGMEAGCISEELENFTPEKIDSWMSASKGYR